MTDSELIAEFMGLEVREPTAVLCRRFKWTDGYFYPVNQLKFHNSWDWLMPVVEKISNTKPMNQAWYDTASHLLHGRIDVVYKRVVEFIRWHDKQK